MCRTCHILSWAPEFTTPTNPEQACACRGRRTSRQASVRLSTQFFFLSTLGQFSGFSGSKHGAAGQLQDELNPTVIAGYGAECRGPQRPSGWPVGIIQPPWRKCGLAKLLECQGPIIHDLLILNRGEYRTYGFCWITRLWVVHLAPGTITTTAVIKFSISREEHLMPSSSSSSQCCLLIRDRLQNPHQLTTVWFAAALWPRQRAQGILKALIMPPGCPIAPQSCQEAYR